MSQRTAEDRGGAHLGGSCGSPGCSEAAAASLLASRRTSAVHVAGGGCEGAKVVVAVGVAVVDAVGGVAVGVAVGVGVVVFVAFERLVAIGAVLRFD